MNRLEQGVLRQVELLEPELVDLTRALVRIPTVNPPGECYAECADLVRKTLAELGYSVEVLPAEGLAEHTVSHPRLNVVGSLGSGRPILHFNGHYDVVAPGAGWSVDPFAAEVKDGRIFGRGTCDQKAGIAASMFAIEAIRRAGLTLHGGIEQSATPDEESGGFAGLAWLCDAQRVTAERQRYVVITEPLDPERVCIGHRGVYWFELVTFGRVGHGSMPSLAQNAAEQMARLLRVLDTDYRPRLATRESEVPVEPAEARHPTLSLNALHAGQPLGVWQSPCVPDRCTAVFDRRFLHEERFEDVKAELVQFLDGQGIQYELRDLMRVEPLMVDAHSELVVSARAAIASVMGVEAPLMVSPGTFDMKHVVRRAAIPQCIGYGPGRLLLAHQPDEHVAIDDLVSATKVMALLAIRLLGAS